MKAVVVHAYGPPDTLRYEDFPDPAPPEAGEVLLRVAAAGVNPADGRLSKGEYPDVWASFPVINGRDVAGIVQAVGAGVTEFAVGDRVFGYSDPTGTGTWADRIVMGASALAHAPASVSLIAAASLPVAALTAAVTLFIDFPVKAGQTLLINGAGGGVGSIAVQMAKNAGLHVIGSASAGKHDFLRSLGCDEVIDYRATPIDTVVHDVDAVLDGVGGDSLERSYRVVKRGGWVASLSGPTDPVAAEKYGIRASQTFGRIEPGLLARIAADVDAGRLRAILSDAYPMREAVRVLKLVNKGHSLGKLVLVNAGVR